MSEKYIDEKYAKERNAVENGSGGRNILVTRSSMPDFDEYIDEIRGLWDSHWLTNMGVKHKELEKRLKEYLGVDNLQLYANGHLSLEMLLQVENLSGEVITTPFTFASTTHAIVRNGLTPVFCDIREDDYTMDADKVEALITDRTTAIVPVHVYGNVCQVEKLQDIAARHGLKLIYDAAHCFGETYKGRGVGSYGDASIFSFHATKVYNTIEGGAVCYRDADMFEPLYFVKNFGIVNDHVLTPGGNAKMNEFAAAMGLCNLRHVDAEIAKRRVVYERYVKNLEGTAGLKLPPVQEGLVRNYAYFPVVIDPDKFGEDRNRVFEKLAENGVHARKYFWPTTNAFECYRDKYDADDTPIALRISERVLTLPMYADLALDDVDWICELILKR